MSDAANIRVGLLVGLLKGPQPFPQAIHRKIQEDTHLRGQRLSPSVKQMDRKRLNLEICKDDPQRTVAYGVGTLVVQDASQRSPLPPFTLETAIEKVRLSQDEPGHKYGYLRAQVPGTLRRPIYQRWINSKCVKMKG
jgi:hypothetical protein